MSIKLFFSELPQGMNRISKDIWFKIRKKLDICPHINKAGYPVHVPHYLNGKRLATEFRRIAALPSLTYGGLNKLYINPRVANPAGCKPAVRPTRKSTGSGSTRQEKTDIPDLLFYLRPHINTFSKPSIMICYTLLAEILFC